MKLDINKISAFFSDKLVFKIVLYIVLSFLFLTKSSYGQDNLRKAEKSFRDWSVFVSKEDPKMCFIASQSIKGEAFRNNQKLLIISERFTFDRLRSNKAHFGVLFRYENAPVSKTFFCFSQVILTIGTFCQKQKT